MNNPLISVIVPVYKVEKYLDRCVESIVNQTYKNLEIILVDDGSPDNCPKMCDEWAEKDNRIMVIHKQNGGVSAARNTGIEASTGKYIAFIDSDDYISVDMIEILYNDMTANNTQLSVCGYYRLEQAFVCDNESKSVNKDEAIVKMLTEPYFNGFVCNKLFDGSVIKENKILFSPKHKMCEDTLFVYKYISLIKNVSICNQALYYYVYRDDSCVSVNDINDYEAILEEIDYFYDNTDSDNVKSAALAFGITFWMGIINNSFLLKKRFDLVKAARKQIKKYILLILKSKYIKSINKIQCVAVAYCYAVYHLYLKIKYM